MSNTILTPTAVTRKAMAIFHNNLEMVRHVNRQYDDQFAKSGAKIGTSLRIREPNQFTVRTGATIDVQDVAETYTTLTLATQKGVDVCFSSVELTMSLDDFGERILEPAMSRLASQVDYEGLSLYADVYNHVGAGLTTPATALVWLQAAQKLNEYACPVSQRTAVLSPAAQTATVNALTGVFNPQAVIGKQYTKGAMGRAFGLDFVIDQNVNSLVAGTRVGTIVGKTTLSAEGASTFVIDGLTAGTETVTAGEAFTIAGVYAVNPETKQSTGALMNFTVSALSTGDGTDLDLTFSPAIYTSASGVLQNVTAFPQAEAAIVFEGVAAPATTDGETIVQNLVFHKDAFCFATADLEMPKGVDFSAREVYDGISMRIVRQYDINNDTFPCRIDILYGWKTLRPQWACRVLG